jgi:hypothetical protein
MVIVQFMRSFVGRMKSAKLSMVGSAVSAFHIVRSLLMSKSSKSFASLSAVEHILSH